MTLVHILSGIELRYEFMITAFMIFFALVLEYIYDPISNMKDTFVIDSAFSKYKDYIKNYKLFKFLGFIFLLIGG